MRFFFTGTGNNHFNIGLQNARLWHGTRTPDIGLAGIDRKILWEFVGGEHSEKYAVRLELPKAVSLLYGFWKLVPEEELVQTPLAEKIAVGKGPIGLPCPQCGGLLWLELGRYGVYLGCTSKCGYTRGITPKDATELARLMGKTCGLCGGQVIGKKAFGGVFLGCCNYPECRWTTPIENLV